MLKANLRGVGEGAVGRANSREVLKKQREGETEQIWEYIAGDWCGRARRKANLVVTGEIRCCSYEIDAACVRESKELLEVFRGHIIYICIVSFAAFYCKLFMEERYNSQHTNVVQIEILGYNLQFTQDPNSKHVGTTIWDTSMVFVKFLERNCKKGEFSNAKLKGKRVIELGSGCGLAGFGMALLGCHVVATDQSEVLPLLLRNIDRNMARVKQTLSESPYLGEIGSIEVVELNWGDEKHIATVEPPFDYIIGTDIVYKEDQLERLVSTLLALAGSKTSILLGYEYRSKTVHEKMLQLWNQHFEVKNVPRVKMDSKFQHESIQLFILRPKHERLKLSRTKLPEVIKVSEGTSMPKLQPNETYFEEHALVKTNAEPAWTVEKNIQYCQSNETNKNHETDTFISESGIARGNTTDALDFKNNLNEWEARRLGSMAARLLQNVL